MSTQPSPRWQVAPERSTLLSGHIRLPSQRMQLMRSIETALTVIRHILSPDARPGVRSKGPAFSGLIQPLSWRVTEHPLSLHTQACVVALFLAVIEWVYKERLY
jgi:hypothetical protein